MAYDDAVTKILAEIEKVADGTWGNPTQRAEALKDLAEAYAWLRDPAQAHG